MSPLDHELPERLPPSGGLRVPRDGERSQVARVDLPEQTLGVEAAGLPYRPFG